MIRSNKDVDEGRLLHEIVERAVKNATDLFEARMRGIDDGITKFHEDLVRVPTTLDRSITSLRELLEARLVRNADVTQQQFNRVDQLLIERDKRVDQMLIERDKRLDQSTVASSTAIAAALQAQKEAAMETQKASNIAIAKAEVATAESIKQLQTLFQTAIGGLTTQVADVKSRLDKGEAGMLSTKEAKVDFREDRHQDRSMTFNSIGTFLGVGALLISIMAYLSRVNIHP